MPFSSKSRSQIGLVRAAAAELAAAAQGGVQGGLQIHSPSRVGMWLGEMYGEGVAEGIEEQVNRVTRAAETLAGAAEADARSSYTGGGMAYTGQAGGIQIDYDELANAVVRGNEAAGLGNAVIAMDKRIVGETTEPYSSRASMLRSQKSVKGRTSRLVLVG